MSTTTIAGMPNAHSHAFQRGLRGVGEPVAPGEDDFWSWREAMFALAGELDPEHARDRAAGTYAELRGAGYTAVGEFHYLHHDPDGTPYPDPNAMAKAHALAAEAAGVRIVLLPAAYHRGGWDGGDLPCETGQRRFVDPAVGAFLERVDALREWADDRPLVGVGVAAHSVRAVPAAWLEAIAAYADTHGLVRHVHAHEQRRELAECAREHGCSPIRLLAETGFLGPRASIVHATHVTDEDIALLAEHGATVVACPTTEGNLGDGVLPALRLDEAGIPLAIGSDSHVRLDPFEELREMETCARRQAERRSALLARHGDLWRRTAEAGARALGLAAGACGTVSVDRDAPELAGIADAHLPAALATCASAAVVRDVRP